MNRKPLIIGIGEVLWDILPEGKRAGGAPANFIYHAIRTGVNGIVVSAVGNDRLGEELIAALDSHNIPHCFNRPDYPTGTVEVTLNDGIPSYDIVQNVAWDHIAPSPDPISLIQDADVIYFGSLASRSKQSRESIRQLIRSARKDVLFFYDINIRKPFYSAQLIESQLQIADILKINDEELDLLRGMLPLHGDDETCCRQLIDRYSLKMVILTAGSRFSAVYSQSDKSVIKTPKVDVVDTVGAGDSFSGAFIGTLAQGCSLAEAHQKAVRISAFVCTQAGAWPDYPHDKKE